LRLRSLLRHSGYHEENDRAARDRRGRNYRTRPERTRHVRLSGANEESAIGHRSIFLIRMQASPQNGGAMNDSWLETMRKQIFHADSYAWLCRLREQVHEMVLNHLQAARSEEHTSELQSRENLVCR